MLLQGFDVSRFPLERIRNFCIIAHIDHGKSTLSDRFLELTGTVKKEDGLREQFLDNLQVERERGITVKAQTCSLIWNYKSEDYLLNLIDTPGHVDFSFEVWRSLSACEGAILLVDANSGVQAQTIAHFNHALLADITILPVMNKIDLKNADIESVSVQMKNLFDFNMNEILLASAKTGIGIEEILDAIIERIPPPTSNHPLLTESSPNHLKAVVFDSWYEKFKGIILLIRVLDGAIKLGSQVLLSTNSSKIHTVKELNVLHPGQVPISGNPPTLNAGQVGVVICNIHDNSDISIGDLVCLNDEYGLELIKSEKESKTKSLKSNPMVYASIYPCEKSEIGNLQKSLQKLFLNDSSVSMQKESHPALGNGFKLGFLGLLHMEVFCQRLDDEFDAQVMITSPSVPYKVHIHGEKNIKQYGSEELLITNAAMFPAPQIIKTYFEPMVKGTIIAPDQFLNSITTLCMDRRGEQLNTFYIDNLRVLMEYRFPLSEIIIDFYDSLKSVSSGYASFDYEDDGFQETELVKLDFRLNDKPVDELSMIVHLKRARLFGKNICDKLADHLTRQQFKIKVQALVGGKVVARSNVSAYRKDVTAKLYGGDSTRRMKLLQRQAEGKRRMRMNRLLISPSKKGD
ncbi:Translation factor guf1 mitochondrial [Blomia tropicalis]|nr:Translation factor guf1 mitochondrial [Blomia tropicalis]